MKIRSGEKCPNLANSFDVKIFRANSIWRKGNKIGDVWRSYPCFQQLSSSKESNGGFLEVFLYNFKSAWGLVLERLLGMVWMKFQSQDGGKKRQRQRQQQIKILYCVTRRIVREMTYRDYDTLRLTSKITEECASLSVAWKRAIREMNLGIISIFSNNRIAIRIP